MPLPLLFVGGAALGAVLGVGGTLAASDAAENISEGASAVGKTLTCVALVGGAIYLATQTDVLKKVTG